MSLTKVNYESCVQNARFEGNLQSVADSLINQADYCQFLLNSTKWPAQELCSYFGTDVQFRIWIGRKCNQTCFFGTKSRDDPNICLCMKGYWNENCSAECPAGSDNPCSGYGTCHPTTGECQCPIQFTGDCSTCKDGWFGVNCSMAYQTNTNLSHILIGISSLGHGQSVEGVNFELKEAGGYNLLILSENLVVQGSFVECQENYVCMSLVGLRLGDLTRGYANITIHAPRLGKKGPSIYINGRPESLNVPVYFTGFKLSQPFQNRIDIGTDFNANLSVSSEYGFLRFQAKIGSELREFSLGLLGTFDSENASNPILNKYFPNKNLHNFYNFCSEIHKKQLVKVSLRNITQNSSTFFNLRKPSWILEDNKTNPTPHSFRHFKIDPCDNILDPDTNTQHLHYSLKLNDTVIFTHVQSKTFHPNITVDFFLKVLNDTGVLFSYSNKQSFSLFYNKTIKLVVNDRQTETNLTLITNHWNKIVFVYNGFNGQFDLYVFDTKGNVARYTDFIIQNIFKDSGYFSVGQWLPPIGKPKFPYLQSLKAEVEKFLIWNILLEPNIIMESWNMNPLSAKNLLSAGWLLDEGAGLGASDFVHGREFKSPGRAWNNPEWVISDLQKSTSRFTTYLNYTFSSKLSQKLSEEYCSAIYDLASSELCLPIPRAVADFYFISCVQFASVARDTEAGRSQVVQFAELCQTQSGLPIDKYLKRKYRDNNTSCRFGTWIISKNNSSFCECHYGYFGNSCQSVCPGGSANPCSRHGTCQENGTCDCLWNWNGIDCSQCKPGLTGSNCSVADISPLEVQESNIAMVFSTGQYLRFDGKVFDLPKETGVFRIFLYDKTDVHIHQTLCQHGTCINAFAILVDQTLLTIYPSGKYGLPEIFVDGKRFEPDRLKMNISKISLRFKSTYELYISLDLKEKVVFKVLIQAMYMTISLKSHSDICKQAIGVLGSCDPSSLVFDFEASTDSQRLQYLNQFKIIGKTNLFSRDPHSILGSFSAGYALFFNNTAALTKPIRIDPQTKRNNTGYSISFLVKPYSHSGTLVSFGKEMTFAVSNTDPIRVTCGPKSQETKAVNVLNEWNQLIVTFDKSKPKVHFYHFGPDKKISYTVLKLTCPDIYQTENVISVGAWHPSFKNPKCPLTNSSFIGLIDELTVWSTALSISTIYQNFHLDTKLSDFGSQLDLFYKFSEGYGYRAQDIKSGNSLFLPTYPWQSPVWVNSDVSLYSLKKRVGERNNVRPSRVVIEACKEFFESKLLGENCPKVPTRFFGTLTQLCATHSMVTPEDFYLSASSMGLLCGSLGGNPEQIRSLICSMKTAKPDWLTLMCRNCKFGRLNENKTCICNPGYWGNLCDKTCPNGNLKPCNLHGYCDTDGQCVCHDQWTGKNCDQCLAGWTGPDCAIMKPDPSLQHATELSAFVFNTRIKTFDLVSFDIKSEGLYRLLTLQPKNFTVLAYYKKYLQDDLCFVSFIIKAVGMNLLVNETSFASGKVTFWDRHRTIDLYRNQSYKGIELTRLTEKSFKMVFNSHQLSITLEFDNKLSVSLSTTLGVKQKLSNGLLASCDTIKEIGHKNCIDNKSSICDSSMNFTCKQDLSSRSLQLYINSYLVKGARGSINTGGLSAGCLFYNNSAMYVKSLSFFHEFTLELHVNPVKYNGVIFSFVQKESHFLVLNSKYGLRVISNGTITNSEIPLELNSWNQINLAWMSSTSSLEIYVIYNFGAALVKAIQVPSDMFTKRGSFIIGSTSEELYSRYDIREGFAGYIDEVRIWRRPHNPTIVTQNWRIKVSHSTPGLSMSWTFDNVGEELIARDFKQGVVMYPQKLTHHPTWKPSSLPLKAKLELDSFKGPVKAANVSLVEEAKRLCRLVFSGACETYCLPLGKWSFDSYRQECVKDVVVSKDPAKSARTALMFAKECQALVNSTSKKATEMVCEILESTSIIPANPDCRTTCLFGNLNPNGSCTCSEGFFGTRCDEVCPIATQGICNLKGSCRSVTKSCECSSHWLGLTQDVISYWGGFSSNNTKYPCDLCSSGWIGNDCNILQVDNIGRNGSVSRRVAMIFGSSVMTFDGLAYTMVTVGSYELFSTDLVVVEGHFEPCRNDYLCRTLVSVSLRLGPSTTLEVKRTEEGLALQLQKEEQVVLSYPVKKDIFSGSEHFKLLWTQKHLVRIRTNNLNILVSLVQSEMFFGVFLSESGKKTKGILGNNDGNQANDISERQTANISRSSEFFSLETIGRFLKTNYKIHFKNGLTNAGFKVVFSENFAQTSELFLENLSRLTVGFWIQFRTQPNTDATFLSFSTNQGIIEFGISKEILFFKHINAVFLSDIRIELDQWFYIALIWQKDNSNIIAYSFSQSNLQYFQYKNEHLISTLDINQIRIISHRLKFEFDYLRLWNGTKSLQDIYNHYNIYTNKLSEGQLLCAMFDEGEGSTTHVDSTSTESGNKVMKNRLLFGPDSSPPEWKPSDLPVHEAYSISDLRISDQEQTVRSACIDALDNPIFENHCKELAKSKAFFIESCIRMSLRGTPPANLTRDMYAFYCKERLDIDQCSFRGFLDFCNEEDTKLSTAIIVIIVFCTLVLVVGLTYCICRKIYRKNRPGCCGWCTGLGRTHDSCSSEGDVSMSFKIRNRMWNPRSSLTRSNSDIIRTIDADAWDDLDEEIQPDYNYDNPAQDETQEPGGAFLWDPSNTTVL